MYEGVELQGIIRSIRPFGAFVDVGSTTDGLLHVSKMLPQHRQYIGNELVVTASEGEEVLVEVVEVNLKTRKFNLREVEIVERKRVAPSQSLGGAPSSQPRAKAGNAPDLSELYNEVLTGDEDVGEEERRLRQAFKDKSALEKWGQKMRNKVLQFSSPASMMMQVAGVGAREAQVRGSRKRGKPHARLIPSAGTGTRASSPPHTTHLT